MRHYQNKIGVSYTGTSPLLEQVFSILDSRIQFIDFQVQRYFTSCTSTMSEASTPEISYCGPSTSKLLVNNLDQLLSFTEKLQDDLKLLQTLKVWLKEETVQEVLDLLTDNRYLTFSEDSLESLLKKKVLIHYQLEVA